MNRPLRPVLCDACWPQDGAEPQHTSPPDSSMFCQCGTRTCACYGAKVRAGFREDGPPTK